MVVMQTFPTVSLLVTAGILMEPTFFGSAAFLEIASVRRSCSNFKIEGVWLESEPTSAKKKKKKEVKSQTTGSSNRNGFGGISSSSSSSAQIKKTPFDASSALIRSAKLYEELSLKASKVLAAGESEENYEGDDIDEEVYSEFLIAAKYVPPTQEDCYYPPGSAGLSDWVPVAQLCLTRNRSTLSSTKMQLHSAVSTYCREIYHAAQTVAPIFNNIPRPHIRYSAEPLDSFFKYVYDNVLSDPSSPQQSDEIITKAQARDILGIPLESTNDLSLIKQRYRTLSMQFHPDSAVSTTTTATLNQDDNDNDISAKFRQVRLAYDTLCSGIRVTDATGTTTGSFYETLGGKDRTDFLHIPPLTSPDQARKDMAETIQSAVIGLDSDTVMAFVTRNLAASVAGNTKNNYKN